PLVLATVLRVLPLQIGPATTPPALDAPADELVVRLSQLRVRWARALDEAGWDRDAPAARTAADEASQELLPLLARTDEVRGEALTLLRELAPPSLGPWLRIHRTTEPALTVAWLRRREDAGLLGELQSAASPSELLDLGVDLALAHRAAAG